MDLYFLTTHSAVTLQQWHRTITAVPTRILGQLCDLNNQAD